MLECMETASATDGYAGVCAKAVASDRGQRPSTEWPEFAPPVGLAAGPLGEVQAADREIARQTAIRARAVAAFAASRPASVDRVQGQPGAMSPERWAVRPEMLRSVSEWAAPELAVALSLSAAAAEGLLERSLLLVHRLTGTLAALEAGALHPGHLWPLLEKVARVGDDRVRAEVEAAVLRWAAGRVTTPGQLGDKVRRELLKRNVRDESQKLLRALRERGVQLRPGPVDGMGEVAVIGTWPEAKALFDALVSYAAALDDDPADPRTRGQKMLDCLLDLVLRPGEADLPPVQVLLTVVASLATVAGGDQPGEIDGQPVPAELIRQFLRALDAGADPEPAPTAATVTMADPADTVVPVAPADAVDAADPAGEVIWANDVVGERTWEEFVDREVAAWSAEMERRILAGEFDADLPPGPGYGDAPVLDEVGWLPDGALPDGALPDGALPDGDPPAGDPPAGDPPAGDPPAGSGEAAGGWWTSADRAVDDAGLALRRADEALAHAHRMVSTAAVADADNEATWQNGAGGRLTDAGTALEALRAATATQRAQLAALLDRTAGGGLAERPRLALTDALSGALLALSDLPGLRRAGGCGARACRRHPERCTHELTGRPGLGPPGATDGYRPAAALDRFVCARDRRCRFPGCRRRVPKTGELDHNTPWPDGETSAANLAGYCTTDHRGKHQAPGWRHDLAPDGTLTVTTPTGLTAVTTPPPY
jgi:hypothetical protein